MRVVVASARSYASEKSGAWGFEEGGEGAKLLRVSIWAGAPCDAMLGIAGGDSGRSGPSISRLFWECRCHGDSRVNSSTPTPGHENACFNIHRSIALQPIVSKEIRTSQGSSACSAATRRQPTGGSPYADTFVCKASPCSQQDTSRLHTINSPFPGATRPSVQHKLNCHLLAKPACHLGADHVLRPETHTRHTVTTVPPMSVIRTTPPPNPSRPIGRLAWRMLDPVHLPRESVLPIRNPIEQSVLKDSRLTIILSCKTYRRPRSSTSALSHPARSIENHSSDRRLHCSCSTHAPTVPVAAPCSGCS